jgi:putative ABC transport system permease protein
MVDGFASQSIENLKKLDTAHIKIFNVNYWDNRVQEPLDYLISDYKDVEKIILKNDEVESITHRTSFQARAYISRYEMPCICIGIDSDDGDKKVYEISKSIIEGEYKLEGNSALIGVDNAKLFNLSPGDFLALEFKDKNGIYDAIQVQIAGIFNTGHPEIDRNVLYLPFHLTQERLDMQDDVTEIGIKLKHENQLNKIQKKLQVQLGKDYSVMTWREQAKDFIKFSQAKNMGKNVVLFILLLIVTVGIWNTMLMSVLERIREIGMIMALGMRKSRVQRIFLTEGAVIGALGAILGMIIGLIGVIYLSETGINVTSLVGERTVGYIIKDYVYVRIQLLPFIISFLMGVGISILASIVPARYGSKLIPMEALRRY